MTFNTSHHTSGITKAHVEYLFMYAELFDNAATILREAASKSVSAVAPPAEWSGDAAKAYNTSLKNVSFTATKAADVLNSVSSYIKRSIPALEAASSTLLTLGEDLIMIRDTIAASATPAQTGLQNKYAALSEEITRKQIEINALSDELTSRCRTAVIALREGSALLPVKPVPQSPAHLNGVSRVTLKSEFSASDLSEVRSARRASQNTSQPTAASPAHEHQSGVLPVLTEAPTLYTVTPNDSWWRVAETHLRSLGLPTDGPSTSRYMHRLRAHNKDFLGKALLPGYILTLPTPQHPRTNSK